RPEPGDVAGGCAGGVVLRLEPGVLAEPGDVKSGAWPAGAGREVELGFGHGFADGCDHLCVRGHPPGRDVVGAVPEMPGELDQGYRAARVLDVAQVEPVAEARRDEQGGQVQGLAAGGRVDERGRGEERVLVAEGAPGAGDPEADDLRAGGLRELLPEELGDLLRPRDRGRGGNEPRQVLLKRAAVRDAAVAPERAGEAYAAHAPFRGGAGDVEDPVEQARG